MAAPPGGSASPVSLRHGVRCSPEEGVTVEDVLTAMGELIGYENISAASRMQRGVVVFVKDEGLVKRLITDGVVVSGNFLMFTPLATPTSKVTVSGVPPFVHDDEIKWGLARYGRFASNLKMVPLAWKKENLKHVMSFRRQVFMFLTQPEIDIAFKVCHEGRMYTVYASTASMKCFECGDVGHKRAACPHKTPTDQQSGNSSMKAEPAKDQHGKDDTGKNETHKAGKRGKERQEADTETKDAEMDKETGKNRSETENTDLQKEVDNNEEGATKVADGQNIDECGDIHSVIDSGKGTSKESRGENGEGKIRPQAGGEKLVGECTKRDTTESAMITDTEEMTDSDTDSGEEDKLQEKTYRRDHIKNFLKKTKYEKGVRVMKELTNKENYFTENEAQRLKQIITKKKK